MKLTVENVRATMGAILPKDGELNKTQIDLATAGKEIDGYIRAEGVRGKFLFVKKRVEEKREDIRSMLSELPDNFHKSKGGGWSFLNACMTRDSPQWGEQRDVDELVCLGLATGFVTFQLPREMWKTLPGGVPYFVVDLQGDGKAEAKPEPFQEQETKNSMTEKEFLGLYARVVSKAKEMLLEANKTCGENWPAGQSWGQLVETSKSIFMEKARAYMLIDDAAFLKTVREWTYSDEGRDTLEALFATPADEGEDLLMVTLKNGTKEVKELVATVMHSIKEMFTDKPLAFYELVMLCRDKNHQIFGGVDGCHGVHLKGLHLINLDTEGKPYVHGSVRNIVLSAVTDAEGGGDMRLVNPVQEEAPA